MKFTPTPHMWFYQLVFWVAYELECCHNNYGQFFNINELKWNVTKTKALVLTTTYKSKKIDFNLVALTINNEKI